MTVVWIDEYHAEIARIADDDSGFYPPRLDESVLGADLIGEHDAGHLWIESSLPDRLARRNILVPVHQCRDVIAPAQHRIETDDHSQRSARVSGHPVSIEQPRDVHRRRRRLHGS